MKKIFCIFLLLSAQLSYAEDKLVFAAFSAVNICANNDGTNHQEVCMFSMYYEPNVAMIVVGGHGEISLDHSVPSLGLNLITNISVKTFEKVIQIKASTVRDGEIFIGPVSITTPSVDLLNTVQYSGHKVCGNEKCDVYYKPFLYLSTPWSSEDMPLNL
jgi:hypothetical protein